MYINVHKCISSICLRLFIHVSEHIPHTEMLMPTFSRNIFGSSRKFQAMISCMCVAAFNLSLGGKEYKHQFYMQYTYWTNIYTNTLMEHTVILTLETHKREHFFLKDDI